MLLLVAIAAAWAATLSLSVEPREMQVGQTVQLKLRLVDGSYRGVPDVPVSNGLDLSYRGQSTQHVIVNFKSTRTVEYSFELTAMQRGEMRVGPVTLLVDGKPVTADPVVVRVAERAEDDPKGAKASLSDTRPYLGEVVVYDFEFRHNGQLRGADWTPPDFDGFVQEQSADAQEKSYRIDDQGQPVTIQQVQMALVAAGQGPQTVSRATIRAQFPVERRRRQRGFEHLMGMTEVRTETFTSEPIEVDIRPLPDKGRPADFSGLVGQFDIRAAPTATRVPLGETVTLNIEVTGDGTLSGFRLPPADKDLPFRAYDDDPRTRAEIADGRFQASAVISRAIVPEAEGPLTIPPVQLSYFDPEAGQYRTTATNPIELMVTPGEGGDATIASFATGQSDQRRDVESLADDILPAPGAASIGDRRLSGVLPVIVGLPLVPLVVVVGLGISQLSSGRKRDPWLDLAQGLQGLPDETQDRIAHLDHVFREACGLLLGAPAPGLTRAEVAKLGEGAVDIYDRLERARYGGGDLGALEADVRSFVDARGTA